MLVGVPKEIKDNEYRVGLVPATVRELPRAGTASWCRRMRATAPASRTPTMSRPARRSSPTLQRFSSAPN